MKLAIDAMGGDNAPKAIIDGCRIALKRFPDLEFDLFGDETQIKPILDKSKKLAEASTIHHTDLVIPTDEKPSVALRQGRKASMGLAIEAVKKGECDAIVSAGNTGALMAISKLSLRVLPNIQRPAICSLFPHKTGESVMLDLGANAECDAENLLQFGIMGDAFAKAILEKNNPTIGLLNIGSEDGKGTDVIKEAHYMLKYASNLNYQGFVEGDDLPMGVTDVIVADGFSGNIALKTAEGTAKLCGHFIKKAIGSSLLGLIGGFFAKKPLRRAFKAIDPRAHNGAMFVGLNGIAVKSHGSTDALGFANAIEVTQHLLKNKINDKIIEQLSKVELKDSE